MLSPTAPHRDTVKLPSLLDGALTRWGQLELPRLVGALTFSIPRTAPSPLLALTVPVPGTAPAAPMTVINPAELGLLSVMPDGVAVGVGVGFFFFAEPELPPHALRKSIIRMGTAVSQMVRQ